MTKSDEPSDSPPAPESAPAEGATPAGEVVDAQLDDDDAAGADDAAGVDDAAGADDGDDGDGAARADDARARDHDASRDEDPPADERETAAPAGDADIDHALSELARDDDPARSRQETEPVDDTQIVAILDSVTDSNDDGDDRGDDVRTTAGEGADDVELEDVALEEFLMAADVALRSSSEAGLPSPDADAESDSDAESSSDARSQADVSSAARPQTSPYSTLTIDIDGDARDADADADVDLLGDDLLDLDLGHDDDDDDDDDPDADPDTDVENDLAAPDPIDDLLMDLDDDDDDAFDDNFDPRPQVPYRSNPLGAAPRARRDAEGDVRARRIDVTVAVYESDGADRGRANAAILGLGYKLFAHSPIYIAESVEEQLIRCISSPGGPRIVVVADPEGDAIITAARAMSLAPPVLVSSLSGPAATARSRSGDSDLFTVKPHTTDSLGPVLYAAARIAALRDHIHTLEDSERRLRERLAAFERPDHRDRS